MHDLAFNDPCILFPLRREARAFYREFRPQQRFPGAPCLARFCGPEWLSVLVLETGVGVERMQSALEWLLHQPVLENVPYRPKVVLVAGFAGALTEDLQVGDIVLASELVDSEGNRWPASWPGELPSGEWRPPLRRGRILTVPHLAGKPEEKRELGSKHEALAVDMESAVAARLCAKHEVPFGCVRAITDRLDQPLAPRLVSLLSGGRVSPGRLALALLRSPTLAPELWRLAGRTRLAADQLAKALGELLTLTLSWGKEL